MTPSGRKTAVMTIGALSHRTGVPVKALREYEDLGLIYAVGRSAGNYRLFDDEALWCVNVIGTLRGLGLTLAEIRDLAATYQERTDAPIGPRLAEVLRAVRARTEQRMAELSQLLERIDDFEAEAEVQLTGRADLRALDPHFGGATLDSPPGERPKPRLVTAGPPPSTMDHPHIRQGERRTMKRYQRRPRPWDL